MENRKDELIRKIQEEESRMIELQYKINDYRKELGLLLSNVENYIGKYITYNDGCVTHYTMLVKEQEFNNDSLLLKGFVLRSDLFKKNNLLNSYHLNNSCTICININGRDENELKVIDKEKFDELYDEFIEAMMCSKKSFEKIEN